MGKVTLVGAAALALALVLAQSAEAGCRRGHRAARVERGSRPLAKAVCGMGRVLGKVLPPWRK